MGLTIGTVVKQGVIGDLKYKIVPVTWDSSYASTGESLTAANLGLQEVIAVIDLGTNATLSSGDKTVRAEYDYTNSKLLAYGFDGSQTGDAALTEVDSLDLSNCVSRLLVIGK